MKLLAVLTICCWAAVSTADVATPFVVQESIEAGQKLTEWFAKAADKTQFPEMLVKISGFLSTFLKGLGPAVKLWMAAFPGDTHEKQVMRKLAEINEQLKQLSQQLKELENKIEWEHTAAGYRLIEDRMVELMDKLNSFYQADDAELKDYWKREFKGQYERYEKDGNLFKLFRGITVSDAEANRNLIRGFARVAEFDRGKIDIFATKVLKLFVQGMELHIAYLAISGESDNVVDSIQNLWNGRQQEATESMKAHDQWVMDEAVEYMNRDFSSRIGTSTGAALNAFNFLKEKYYWREIVVLRVVKKWYAGWYSHRPCSGHVATMKYGADYVYAHLVSFLKTNEGEQARCAGDLSWLHGKANNGVVRSGKTLLKALLDRAGRSCLSPFALVDVIGHDIANKEQPEGYTVYATNSDRVRRARFQYILWTGKHTVTVVC